MGHFKNLTQLEVSLSFLCFGNLTRLGRIRVKQLNNRLSLFHLCAELRINVNLQLSISFASHLMKLMTPWGRDLSSSPYVSYCPLCLSRWLPQLLYLSI